MTERTGLLSFDCAETGGAVTGGVVIIGVVAIAVVTGDAQYREAGLAVKRA